nr:hypothetical protein [Tanacetum cinerariifolium]
MLIWFTGNTVAAAVSDGGHRSKFCWDETDLVRLATGPDQANWCCLCWGQMGVVIGSRVVMEMGEKMAEKGVGKRTGNTVLGTVF